VSSETLTLKRSQTKASNDRASIGVGFLCGDDSPAYTRAILQSPELVKSVEQIGGRKIRKKDAGIATPNRSAIDVPVVALCGKHYERIRRSGRARIVQKPFLTENQIQQGNRPVNPCRLTVACVSLLFQLR
jgi:hypothetical protein